MLADFDYENPQAGVHHESRAADGAAGISPCGVIRGANAAVAGGRVAYVYHYDFHTPATNFTSRLVMHTDELQFVWRRPWVLERSSAEDRSVSILMSEYWANFVRYLDPNGLRTEEDIGTATVNRSSAVTRDVSQGRASRPRPAYWQPWNAEGRVLRMDGSSPSMVAPAVAQRCRFWQELMQVVAEQEDTYPPWQQFGAIHGIRADMLCDLLLICLISFALSIVLFWFAQGPRMTFLPAWVRWPFAREHHAATEGYLLLRDSI